MSEDLSLLGGECLGEDDVEGDDQVSSFARSFGDRHAFVLHDLRGALVDDFLLHLHDQSASIEMRDVQSESAESVF